MLLFALDSTGKSAGAAILRDGEVLYQADLRAGLTHSEMLLPLCDDAFRRAGVTPGDIGLWAAAAGPGSFTGLRIGLATLKGLALPYSAPAAGVSTLLAAAWTAPAGGTVLSAVDAGRGGVYWACFSAKGRGVARLSPDTAGPAADAAAFAAGLPGPLYVTGDGAALFADALPDAILMPAGNLAVGVAFAAEAMLAAGETVSPQALRPAYHRLSQAQRERAARLHQEVEE